MMNSRIYRKFGLLMKKMKRKNGNLLSKLRGTFSGPSAQNLVVVLMVISLSLWNTSPLLQEVLQLNVVPFLFLPFNESTLPRSAALRDSFVLTTLCQKARVSYHLAVSLN